MNPVDAIHAGRDVLESIMTAAGFRFVPPHADKGSGGPFAEAAYVHGDRRLAFSYREALGCVEYAIGDARLEHIAYMRLLGVYPKCAFASFSREEPLAGFRALRDDLAAYAGDFLAGPGDDFVRLAAELQAMPGGQLPRFLP